MTDSLEKLRYRRKVIAAEVHDLNERVAALTSEDAELAAAERILSRFIEEPGYQVSQSDHSPEANGKPSDTPTTPQMILLLLKEAERDGKQGLEPKEMLISISKRWWPAVKSEDVGPTAWRMWKDGRLHKEGSLYKLAKTREATGNRLRSAVASE